ncbi:MAG: hypothetical protein ACREBD_03910 [Blastocatellia bacterium]
MQVTALRVRDTEGRMVRDQLGRKPRVTDERGVYRLYGLIPGTYVIAANGYEIYSFLSSPYDDEVPTYYPSSTRDTAGEVVVTSGVETTGVDIRYRGGRGYTVSGAVSGAGSAPSGLFVGDSVLLIHSGTGTTIGSVSNWPGEKTGFAFHGVADGEYDVIACRGGDDSKTAYASQPRRVVVRGVDVTGIDLKFSPLASVSGKVAIETGQNTCENTRKSAIEEIVLSARRDENAKSEVQSPFQTSSVETTPNEKGEFSIRNLDPGRYRIEPKLPNENWYVRSIMVQASAPATRPLAAASPTSANGVLRSGIALKSGDDLKGITVTIAEGAAMLRGKVVAEKDGARLPARLRIHLVPAEPASSDDVQRYFETLARNDGEFGFGNLAPGRYWLLARVVPDDEPSDRLLQQVAWDSLERAKLRKEAEVVKVEVKLKACQQVTNQFLRYSFLRPR